MAWAQDDSFEVEDPLRAFEEQPSALEKFKFFFETSNRYEENSAYDWMDRVNADLSEATRNKDTAAVKAFELMRAQLYYDLGSFQQSVPSPTSFTPKLRMKNPICCCCFWT